MSPPCTHVRNKRVFKVQHTFPASSPPPNKSLHCAKFGQKSTAKVISIVWLRRGALRVQLMPKRSMHCSYEVL